jgi:ubiquinone/menaquinone biosynthesis C-methylase UbiE
LLAPPTATNVPEPAASSAWQRWKTVYGGGGLVYSALYAARWMLKGVLDRFDRRLVGVEQRRCLVGPWTISAKRHTSAENKQLWNTYDWSQLGEEWTRSAEWKREILEEFLYPNVPEAGELLEIGPGGGRWTDVLRHRASKLYVVDIAERVLDLCRQRFAGSTNIEYVLSDGHSLAVPAASVEAVWSYDVFVHINPVDARGYFQEINRVLKPGRKAVIHHPGTPPPGQATRPGWRSDLTDKMVLQFAASSGLEVVSQATKLVNQGDYLTVFRKPAN